MNQQLHELKRSELGTQISGPIKFPPWFDIDVHIDDSVEIEADGRQHGFKVIRVDPDDADWVATVLAAMDAIERAR